MREESRQCSGMKWSMQCAVQSAVCCMQCSAACSAVQSSVVKCRCSACDRVRGAVRCSERAGGRSLHGHAVAMGARSGGGKGGLKHAARGRACRARPAHGRRTSTGCSGAPAAPRLPDWRSAGHTLHPRPTPWLPPRLAAIDPSAPQPLPLSPPSENHTCPARTAGPLCRNYARLHRIGRAVNESVYSPELCCLACMREVRTCSRARDGLRGGARGSGAAFLQRAYSVREPEDSRCVFLQACPLVLILYTTSGNNVVLVPMQHCPSDKQRSA